MTDQNQHTQTVMDWYKADKQHNLRVNYDLDSDSIVFDIGAYNGNWAKHINNRYNCTVYAFEPTKYGFKEAYKNIGNIDKIHLYNYAIKNFDGVANIFFSNDGSSFHNVSDNMEEVQVRSIINVINDFNINTIDLIKLNVEGDEYEILDSIIENGMLKIINHLQIQFHRDVFNYKAKRQNIHDHLLKTHKMMYNFEFVWESWSKV